MILAILCFAWAIIPDAQSCIAHPEPFAETARELRQPAYHPQPWGSWVLLTNLDPAWPALSRGLQP